MFLQSYLKRHVLNTAPKFQHLIRLPPHRLILGDDFIRFSTEQMLMLIGLHYADRVMHQCFEELTTRSPNTTALQDALQ